MAGRLFPFGDANPINLQYPVCQCIEKICDSSIHTQWAHRDPARKTWANSSLTCQPVTHAWLGAWEFVFGTHLKIGRGRKLAMMNFPLKGEVTKKHQKDSSTHKQRCPERCCVPQKSQSPCWIITQTKASRYPSTIRFTIWEDLTTPRHQTNTNFPFVTWVYVFSEN